MKRKTSGSTLSNNEKKRRKEDTQLADVINLGIPHVGEHIFESLETDDLVKCLEVSQTWQIFAEKISDDIYPESGIAAGSHRQLCEDRSS